MRKLLIVIFTLLFLTGFSQENYKLGNFKSSVVQMKKAKIGNDWIMYKNSANSGLYITYQGTTELYLTSGGNLTATGTISGAGAGTFTSLSFGTTPQTIVETNLNMATFNNSLKVTDTLFIGSAQWIRQSSTNRLTSEGSIAAADTLLGALASITTKITLGVQQLTQGNTNRIDANNSVKVTDTLFIGSNQYLMQTTTNKLKTEGSLGVTDTLSIGSTQYLLQSTVNKIKTEGSIAATDSVTGSYMYATGSVGGGTDLFVLSKWYIDGTAGSNFDGKLKYGGNSAWLDFATIDTIGINHKIKLTNISDVSIQNKAGSGQVEIIERDTTGATAKINLTNIKLATADSARMNRIVISDTLQGLVLYTSAGVKYRLRVSPTGVLSVVAVP